MSPVSSFQVTEASEHRLRLAWVPVAGSTGYRLVWRLAEGECSRWAPPCLCQPLHCSPSPISPLGRGAPAQPAAPGHRQLL